MKNLLMRRYFTVCFLEYVGLFLVQWFLLESISLFTGFSIPLWLILVLAVILNPVLVWFSSLRLFYSLFDRVTGLYSPWWKRES